MPSAPDLQDTTDLDDEIDRRPLLYLVLAALIWLVIAFAPRIFYVVPAGSAGVLFRPFFHGVVLDTVYGEGLQICLPFNRLTTYDLRIKELPIEYPVLNGNGLELNVKISVRYHPRRESLAYLHQQVGPDYERIFVVPVVEYCVRDVLGSSSINDVYSNREDMMDKITHRTARMLSQRFIELDGLVFRSIGLPPNINAAIQEKEMQRQRLESYDYRLLAERQEALRKQIEAYGVRGYNTLVRASVDERMLKWQGIEATRALASAPSSKVVVVGNGPQGLPLILGHDAAPTTAQATTTLGDFSIEQVTSYLRDFDLQVRKVLERAGIFNASSDGLSQAGSATKVTAQDPTLAGAGGVAASGARASTRQSARPPAPTSSGAP